MNAPCRPFPVECVPCPHPPIERNLSGPDEPGIACWVPEGCCLPSPCLIGEWEFLCAVRSLLPEGDIYNNTRESVYDPPRNLGVMTIGCARVGCEQLIFGGCCNDQIKCDDDPIAPQLAVVDSYAATAYGVLQQLCEVMKEFDPCTTDLLRRKWAKRYGLVSDNPCDPQWSDNVLAQLLCILPTLKTTIFNWEKLVELAGRFGADIVLRRAGDFSDCAPNGWWTMARDRQDCPPEPPCPPEAYVHAPPWVRLVGECVTGPDSWNLVLCPSDIRYIDNCNLQPLQMTAPHDPELYEAFKWLLPKILPQPVFWCVYQCGEPDECVK